MKELLGYVFKFSGYILVIFCVVDMCINYFFKFYISGSALNTLIGLIVGNVMIWIGKKMLPKTPDYVSGGRKYDSSDLDLDGPDDFDFNSQD